MTACRRKYANGCPKNSALELPEHKPNARKLAHGRAVAGGDNGGCLAGRAGAFVSRGACKSSGGMSQPRTGDSVSGTAQLPVLCERSSRSNSERVVFSSYNGWASL